jgi:hypothetical protein
MRRPAEGDVVDGPAPLEAYKEGRRDERLRADHESVDPGVERAELKDAYERGRREERLRRRGSPLISVMVLLAVLVGAGLVYLAVRNGSFSRGGAVVDQGLAKVSQSAQAPIKGAADKTGDALQTAGQNLKQNAGSGHN